jgi:hypothetical protein
MKRMLMIPTLVMAFCVVAVPTASAAPGRLTYHCTQELATNVEPIGVKLTGVDDQVTHVTQHGLTTFDCPGLGTGTIELWVQGNVNPQLVGMLQGTSTWAFSDGSGGFNNASQTHGVIEFINSPPFFVFTWTGRTVGHGFGDYEGWQFRSIDQRDLSGITLEVELFNPGK